MKQYFYELATDQRTGFMDRIAQFLLLGLSFLFRVILSIRSVLYNFKILQIKKLPVPVISVGNVTFGGVGKTPLIIWLARYFKSVGKNPVVLTRGYTIGNGQESDEMRMLRRSLTDVPVVVGQKRFEAACEYLRNGEAHVFLLDDGFQHWRLKRDLDIVAVDATRPFGNGHLLPRGILREPVTALKRADVVIVTRANLNPLNAREVKHAATAANPKSLVAETIHAPEMLWALKSQKVVDCSVIKDKNICSFCAVGNPESFAKTLINLDVRLIKNFAFADHYPYGRNDIERVLEFARSHDIQFLVTTEKDAVKLKPFFDLLDNDIPCLVLTVNIQFLNCEHEFIDRINRIF